jgi:hypothetical protein
MNAIVKFSAVCQMAMRITVVGLLVTLFSPIGSIARCDSPDCPCGPNYCQDDPRYTKAMAAKKASLKKDGYPDKLLALLDKDGKCYQQVTTSPSKFTIRLIYSDQQKNFPWTQQDEDLARKEVLRGEIKAFYMFNVDKAFNCCGEPDYRHRPDWDSNLDLNRDLSIGCTKSGAAVVCR